MVKKGKKIPKNSLLKSLFFLHQKNYLNFSFGENFPISLIYIFEKKIKIFSILGPKKNDKMC
jgi:hypothetical protein